MQPMSETWAAADGTVITIRPISAADLALEQEFVDGLSASTGYQRLMSARRPSFEELRRFTDIDPERELALIATTLVKGRERQIGVARYVKDESSPSDAEFGIVVSAILLTAEVPAQCASHQCIRGEVLPAGHTCERYS